MRKPTDLSEVIYGYIVAVPVGFVVWAATLLLAQGYYPLSEPVAAIIFVVPLLPFALAAVMVLGLPFTLAFLWVMRYFRIRSLTVFLLGGAIAPYAAIFLGQTLVGIFLSFTGNSDISASRGFPLETIPAGIITFYTLYRLRLRPCFEKEVAS